MLAFLLIIIYPKPYIRLLVCFVLFVSTTFAQQPFYRLSNIFSKNTIETDSNRQHENAVYHNEEVLKTLKILKKVAFLAVKDPHLYLFNNSTQALQLLKSIPTQSPIYFNALYQLGYIHVSLANLDSVQFYAQQCIKLALTNPEAYALIKDYYQLNYQFNKVLNNAQKIIVQQLLLYTFIGLSFFILPLLYIFFRLRNSNKQLNAAIEEVRQQSQSKEKLFTIIAHDIRRPFHAYQGMNEMIGYLLQKKDYTEIQKLSIAIDESGLKIRNLFDNLLNWALTETQEMPYRPENVFVKPLITEIVEIYETLNLYKKVIFRVECPPTITAYVDKNGLSLILRNLIENSFKALSTGGTIEIKVYQNTTNKTMIIVKDNAGGFVEEKLKIVKNIFERPDKAFIGQDGMGLGIVLISKFTAINQGSIRVSLENSSLIFNLEFPALSQ